METTRMLRAGEPERRALLECIEIDKVHLDSDDKTTQQSGCGVAFDR